LIDNSIHAKETDCVFEELCPFGLQLYTAQKMLLKVLIKLLFINTLRHFLPSTSAGLRDIDFLVLNRYLQFSCPKLYCLL